MEKLVKEIKDFLLESGIKDEDINENLMLLGDKSIVKSRDLVEILLIVEDFLDENYDIEFDWSSSNAMSSASSNFRNLGSLFDHIRSLI
tara:strand:+ start:231 stop:497 length:267 start_codon:yes stop_codon:yes gene_type:complete